MAVLTCRDVSGVDCSNLVKPGAKGCWRHPDGVKQAGGKADSARPVATLAPSDREAVIAGGLGQYDRSVYIPTSDTFRTDSQMSAQLLIDNTVIAPDIAAPVMGAISDMELDHQLDVPAYVGPRLVPLLKEFRDRMVSGGVDARRISHVEMRGLHRRTPNGLVQHSAESAYLVTVLDANDRGHQTVVDPCASMMTPVRDPRAPVWRQFDSPASPLADLPMVAPLRDYVYGDYLWFDHHQPVRLD